MYIEGSWTSKPALHDLPLLPKVIGAGLPRTGTHSLKKALEILGFGPCHHMTDCIVNRNRSRAILAVYKKVLNKEPYEEDLRRVLRGYGSAVDEPLATLAPEIASVLPDAKIILSVRDSPAAWWMSLKTLLQLVSIQTFVCAWPFFSAYRAQMALRLGGVRKVRASRLQEWNNGKPVETGPELYEKHNQMVLSMFPKEKVLVHNAKEGWDPLCEFLGVPVPDVPYPRSNEGGSFTRAVQNLRAMGIGLWGATFALSGFAVKVLWQHFELDSYAILKQLGLR